MIYFFGITIQMAINSIQDLYHALFQRYFFIFLQHIYDVVFASIQKIKQ